MASGCGVRRGGWDADEASDSRQRDRKRKREKEKKDRKEKDRGEHKADRRKRDWELSGLDYHQHFHGSSVRGHGHHGGAHQESASKRLTQHLEPVRGEFPGSGSSKSVRGATATRAEDGPQQQKPQNWREEVDDTGEDERDFSDDEATAQRKLEESRRRREAMMAKWVNREEEKGAEDSDPPLARTVSKGGAATDGGSSGVEGAKSDAEELDEARAQKHEVQNFVLQAKKDEESTGDMFDTSVGAAAALKSGVRQSAAISLTGASGDDWDDQEGYYLAKVGEVLDDRYLVQETVCGRGVFSNVVKAKDRRQEGEPLVAIKIIRSNDMMKKAAEKEIEILQKLNLTDKSDKKHVIRLLETFYYRKHIFLVFECMWDDLRAALKKYTKNKGMALQAVRVYTKQLLVGVRHMHKCNIIHADIKPDNILISEGNNIVKLCDLGTAVELKDITVSPYLMSRFYRPPEIILGCEYGVAVDIWALSCTLYEIFTGKTLLMGKTNNDQLKKIMEVKGKIPGKVIKKGAVWKQHFDENLDFKYEDTDKVTGEKVLRIITDNSAKRDLKDLILERVGPEKRQSQEREDEQYVKKSVHFSDLLDKTLALDPEKRLTADDGLKHHFLLEPALAKASDRRR
mmetsp:Transcript_25304/g.79826  ORF Transcript_25304/g.79826 Transcript_25304/m.79826 type:complete len:628 (-) Transcript_25304:536-2419(-)